MELNPENSKGKIITNIKSCNGNSSQIGGKNNTGSNLFELLLNPLLLLLFIFYCLIMDMVRNLNLV